MNFKCLQWVKYALRHLTSVLVVCVVCSLSQAAFVCAQDAGRIWNPLGPAGSLAKVVVLDPVTPTTIYAGMVQDVYHPLWGVYKSMDAGTTWSVCPTTDCTVVSTGLPAGYGVYALAIDPRNPSIIYAGISGYDAQLTGGGVYWSSDSGVTWSDTGLQTSGGVFSLAISPQTYTLYAGAFGDGLFMKADTAATWTAIGQGTVDPFIHTIAINPQTPSVIYAGTASSGIFKSSDWGSNWSSNNTGLPASSEIFTLAIDPQSPSTLYAGSRQAAFKSTDDGNTWNAVDNSPWASVAWSEIHAFTIDPVVSGKLYIAAYLAGMFVSTDGGNSWSDLNNGLFDSTVHSVALAADGVTLFTGTCSNGVFILP